MEKPCEHSCSAQLAQLKALTGACALGEGRLVTTHTESAYAHNVCHFNGAHWKQRGFTETDGTPIQHLHLVI